MGVFVCKNCVGFFFVLKLCPTAHYIHRVTIKQYHTITCEAGFSILDNGETDFFCLNIG